MIKEGSFKEYVNMWSVRFPQRKLIPRIRELHSKYGLVLPDSYTVAKAMGAEEEVIFEVGENVLIKKKNDRLTVYHKVGEIWVAVDEGIDVFDSEDILSRDSQLRPIAIYDESNILHSKSVRELAKSTMELINLCRKGLLFPFGSHEIWKLSDDNRILIYSKSLKDQSIFNSEEEIAKHIECYRKAHRLEFGSF